MVWNWWGTLAMRDGVLAVDWEGAIEYGVWQTDLEANFGITGRGEVSNTFLHHAKLEERGALTLTEIRPGQRARLDELGMPPEFARHAVQDLERGYTLVLVSAGDRPPSVWWRIDPKTGTTLGMLGSGAGGMAEEIATFGLVVGSIISGIGVLQCAGRKGTMLTCCLADAALTGAVMAGAAMGVGTLLGVLFVGATAAGEIALITFGIFDVGLNAASLYNGISLYSLLGEDCVPGTPPGR